MGRLQLGPPVPLHNPSFVPPQSLEDLLLNNLLLSDDDDDEKSDEKEEKVSNLGLRELIDPGDSSSGRILHRNINAGSPRSIKMEGLKVANANLVVYLRPSKARNVADAIYREVSSLLFKFNETFDGVLLAYDVNFPSNLAKILLGIHPYVGVRLEAKLLLFHPKPDMVLEGEVVKLSEQSIHIVVLGFSSAVIMDEDIRDEFKHKAKHGKEVFRSIAHEKHTIGVGTIVRFLVKSFDEEILHISGSLLPAHTGCVKWLERHLEEWSQAESNIKKRRANKETEEIYELDKVSNGGETFAVTTSNSTKKSKRRKDGNA